MQRPERLDFHAVAPNVPVRLAWHRPDAAVEGFVVLETANAFPPELTAQVFAGKMADFVSETRLGPDAAELRLDAPAGYCAVLAVLSGDRWVDVGPLREVGEDAAPRHPMTPTRATQTRTFIRARWSPAPSPSRDRAVCVWRSPDEPSDADLTAMLTGSLAPDYRLDPAGDGFIDTVTEEGFRVYYSALAIDAAGGRRPLRLSAGGLMRLERPELLDTAGQQALDALIAAIVDQLLIDIQLKSAVPSAIAERLARAEDLSPGHAGLRSVRQRAERRFGVLG